MAPPEAGPPDSPTVISNRSPPKSHSASDSASPYQKWGLAPGDRLAHFELLDFVGGGGMGRVFRARDTHLARVVALKVLSADQAADGNTLLRFQNEAQSAARLDHPNIVRVYYLGEDRGIPFIVFEYIQGQNARDLIAKRGPLDLAEAVGYILQVAEALAHAARHDVVHRDIKPSNVLVTQDGSAKLIDLGLARLQDPTANDLTASGVTLGTFDYISPEQARDPRTADVRSDIYSLGCTFFYMLSGRPPFPEGTVLQKLLQHQGDQPPDVRQFRPDLPEEVSRLLRKMLAKDPRHRHQTPGELVEELVLLAEQVGLRPARAGGTVWVAPPPPPLSLWERHLPWVIPVSALVVIVLLWDLWSTPREEPLQRAALNGAPPAVAPAPLPAAPVDTQSTTAPAAPDSAPPAAPAAPDSALPSGQPAAAGQPVEKPAALPAALAPERHEPAPAPEPPVGLRAMPAPAEPSGAAQKSAEESDTPADLPRLTAPASKSTGLLVVGDELAGARSFNSLGAACSAAASGDVILLRYNGRRSQRPTVVGNVKVTIRGDEGYRPVVVFRPDDPDPVRYPHSMFSILGGQLTMINVCLQLEVPRDLPAEDWSLVEVLGGESVRLKNCWLSISNAGDQGGDYHQDVAFVRLKSAPGAELAAGARAAPLTPVAIELDNCVARGEAVFLRAEGLQPLSLTWGNGLLATSQFLLSADGEAESPKTGQVRQLDLRHLTALMRRGLCRLSVSQSAPHQTTTRIRVSDSILIGGPGANLIENVGSESADQCRRWIEWNGDRNFYQNWQSWWTIATSDPSTPPETMSFEAWQLFWGPERESLPELNRVVWKKLPETDRPVHRQTPADYALGGELGTSAARGAASDGGDAGMRSADLPPAPPESEPEAAPLPDESNPGRRMTEASTGP